MNIQSPVSSWSLPRLNTPAKGILRGVNFIFFSAQCWRPVARVIDFLGRFLGNEFLTNLSALGGTPITDEVLWRLLSQGFEDLWPLLSQGFEVLWRLLSQGFALVFALGGSGLTWLSHWKKFVRVFVLPFLLTIFGNEDGVWKHHSLVYG